ncbi:MAG: cell wall-binding repeat-containing protein [Lachnospiraceae bacterium]|nr:cell wall-binding repeat-containing protein [Lachnospiraceae bacterium]
MTGVTSGYSVYLFQMKQAALTDITNGTAFCSELTTASNGTVPTAANFTIDNTAAFPTYTGSAITVSQVLSMITSKTYTKDVAVGDVINGKSSGFTTAEIGIVGIEKGGTTYTANTRSQIITNTTTNATDAGTYNIKGYIKMSGVGNEGAGSKTIFSTAGSATEPITLGSFKVAPKQLDSATLTVKLADLSQFADTSYTVASLALTSSAINSKETVNAKNAKVILVETSTGATEDKSATKNAGTAYAYITLAKASLDNANYTLAAEKKFNSSVAVKAVNITGIAIKENPTNLYYKVGANFNPKGLVITLNYEGGKSTDIYCYDTAGSNDGSGTFTFDPDTSTALKISDNKVSVTYSINYKSYTATSTIPITVMTNDVALTKISIPDTLKTNINGTVDLPSVTYTSAKTNTDKTVTWKLPTVAVSGTTHDANDKAYFVDANGDEADSISGSSLIAAYNAVAIKGNAKGTASLTATVGSFTDDCTVTVSSKSDSVEWMRLAGDDRYTTAAKVAAEAFPDGVATKDVVIVSGESIWDALSASGYAGTIETGGVPILLTAKDSIPDATATLLKDWGITSATIIGGEAVVSAKVKSSLENDYKITTNRIAGDDRIKTAEEVANAENLTDGDYDVVVTTSKTGADAVSVSGFAYSRGYVILLTDANGNLSTASQAIAEKAEFGLILGGNAAVNSSVDSLFSDNDIEYKRLAGQDRYDTSAMLADWATPGGPGSGMLNYTAFANGEDAHLVDALSAGQLTGMTDSPILLVSGTSGYGFNYVKNTYVKADSEVTSLYMVGGTSVIPATTVSALLSGWANPKEVTSFS